MSAELYPAERERLQRAGFEASYRPLPECVTCPHLRAYTGYRMYAPREECGAGYAHFLQPCPVLRRERERASAPARETLEEVG